MIRHKHETTLTQLSDREIQITRVFDAPRASVYKAFTDPELIPRWWGPRRLTTVVDKLDARPGGAWRFINRGPDGSEHGFHGEYLELEPPARLVYTFEWEGMPGHVSVETVTLEEQDGKTTMTSHSRFQTAEDCTGMLQSGMEEGMNDSYERLDELFAQQ